MEPILDQCRPYSHLSYKRSEGPGLCQGLSGLACYCCDTDKKHLGEERGSFHFRAYSSLRGARVGSQGRSSGQEPGAQIMEECSLLAWSPALCSICCLNTGPPSGKGTGLCGMPPITQDPRKLHTDLATVQANGGSISAEDPPPVCQVDN